MSLTSQEILAQFPALEQTLAVMENRSAYESVLRGKSLLLTGCGSSYTLCVSAAWMLRLRGVSAFAVPAGDLIAQPEIYTSLMHAGAALVSPSRSGKTSECLMAMELARKAGMSIVTIVSDEASPMATGADACVSLPFAFDSSVCQTRNVSCFFAAFAYLAGVLGGDDKLLADLKATVAELPGLFAAVRPGLERVAAARPYVNAFVLADGPLAGLGAEGALAFCEIARLQAEHKHLLDVRHGPMVLARENSLVLMVTPWEQNEYLPALVRDFVGEGHNCQVILAAPKGQADLGETLRVPVAADRDIACAGLPMILCCQWLALCVAGARGFDPDAPEGLSAWIKL